MKKMFLSFPAVLIIMIVIAGCGWPPVSIDNGTLMIRGEKEVSRIKSGLYAPVNGLSNAFIYYHEPSGRIYYLTVTNKIIYRIDIGSGAYIGLKMGKSYFTNNYIFSEVKRELRPFQLIRYDIKGGCDYFDYDAYAAVNGGSNIVTIIVNRSRSESKFKGVIFFDKTEEGSTEIEDTNQLRVWAGIDGIIYINLGKGVTVRMKKRQAAGY